MSEVQFDASTYDLRLRKAKNISFKKGKRAEDIMEELGIERV